MPRPEYELTDALDRIGELTEDRDAGVRHLAAAEARIEELTAENTSLRELVTRLHEDTHREIESWREDQR